MQPDALSVSQLNEYVRALMEADALLSEVTVVGEISNLVLSRPGHFYFTLKDADGQLRSVMFRGAASRLQFSPADGMRVIAYGRISVYSPSGQYQLYVEALREDGAGALARQFEQLRRRLEAEGLFSAARKRPLPAYPGRIGLITSPYGAAVQDMVRILGRRYPAAEVLIYPSLVQGAEAPAQLIEGLRFFEQTGCADLLLLGRGGGSAEDLWAFNDEALVRAVAACRIPVISAVGHENDYTLCDYAADLRASTPSAAAELAVPDGEELRAVLQNERRRLDRRIAAETDRLRRQLMTFTERPALQSPARLLERFSERADRTAERLVSEMQRRLERVEAAFLQSAGRLEALSPLAVLGRGYAAIRHGEEAVTLAGQLSVGDALCLRLSDGSVNACVTAIETEKQEEHNGYDKKTGNDL